VIGTVATDSGWGQWAGGTERSFERADVIAIGKLRRTGDNRIHLVVRLADNHEVFINASTQSADDGRWLYKAGKDLQPGHDSVNWKAVQP
jgi:hypothetical protein